MKSEGIDHVVVIVRDVDQAVQSLSKLFEMEFEEIPWAKDRMGMRISISLPDGQVELISVVDPVKAAKMPPPFNEIAEFSEKRGEGIYNFFLRVKDADQAVADVKKKGVRIANIIEEKGLGTIIPHFKEVFFAEEDLPFKRISMVWRDPQGRG